MSHEREYPVGQPIRAIDIDTIPEVQGGYAVGRNGVTLIEACTKSGMYADIAYVRVWADKTCLAEFCQHNIVGVYFDPVPEAADEDEAARCKRLDLPNYVNSQCTTCELAEADCTCILFQE